MSRSRGRELLVATLVVVALSAIGCGSGGKLPSYASVEAVADEMTKNGAACEPQGDRTRADVEYGLAQSNETEGLWHDWLAEFDESGADAVGECSYGQSDLNIQIFKSRALVDAFVDKTAALIVYGENWTVEIEEERDAERVAKALKGKIAKRKG